MTPVAETTASRMISTLPEVPPGMMLFGTMIEEISAPELRKLVMHLYEERAKEAARQSKKVQDVYAMFARPPHRSVWDILLVKAQ